MEEIQLQATDTLQPAPQQAKEASAASLRGNA
jgi:hypothetical protein